MGEPYEKAAGPADVAEPIRVFVPDDLADELRAVFAEPEYSPKLMQALAQSAGIRTVENLYDDSVGTDPKVATYVGMIDYDTDVIVAALK